MDRIGLQTLRAEMLADGRIMQDAHAKAAQRLARAEEVAYEGCAHQLWRFYNAFEQAGLRLAKAFENHIDDDEGWHTALLNRLCLEIEGVRPALIAHELKNPLNELRGFRHVFVHYSEIERLIEPETMSTGYFTSLCTSLSRRRCWRVFPSSRRCRPRRPNAGYGSITAHSPVPNAPNSSSRRWAHWHSVFFVIASPGRGRILRKRRTAERRADIMRCSAALQAEENKTIEIKGRKKTEENRFSKS